MKNKPLDFVNDNIFQPVPWLKNNHLMTVIPAFWPRSFRQISQLGKDYLFPVDEKTSLMGRCHFQSYEPHAPTVIIVHGLEGSSNSRYVLGISAKAISAGMNVVRLNLRNCGETLKLSPTFYNAGQSGDIIAVVDYLSTKFNFQNIYLIGYSLGGNIVLKAAGESGCHEKHIRGVCAISPSIDLRASVEALKKGINRLYEMRFLLSLKGKVVLKNRLFPEKYDLSLLKKVNSIQAFDDVYTAPDAGYASAMDYYQQASALAVIDKIVIPSIIVTAQDDPIIPYSSFLTPKLANSAITLLAPKHGGHGGFIHSRIEHNPKIPSFDRFWAENRVLSFCLEQAYRNSVNV